MVIDEGMEAVKDVTPAAEQPKKEKCGFHTRTFLDDDGECPRCLDQYFMRLKVLAPLEKTVDV